MYSGRLCRQASHFSAIVRRRQRRFLLGVRWSKSSFSSSSSSWQYTNLPWSRKNPSASKADSLLTQANQLKKKKFKQLEEAVRIIVQQHLFEKHADLFRGTTLKELNELHQEEDEEEQQQPQSTPQTEKSVTVGHSAIETLALLNGFERVDTPTQEERVPLAEGIVAKAGYYSRIRRQEERIKYTLYSQPIVVDDQHHHHHQVAASTGVEDLPALVEPDITIYRILESRVEDWLNAWRDALRTRFQRLLQRVVVEPVQESNNNPKGTDEMSEHVAPKQPKEEPEENLLVVTNHNNLVLVTQMRPSLRLLALPHDLGHKSASTLISVSIVVFGAIPVAYRSFNFALAYPGLATAIKVSVIGTILYGIWSTRSIARTSQSQVVAKGLARRVFARDDAVVLVLQNGAIQRVTEAVLDVYLQDSNKIGVLASKRHAFPGNLVDPVDIALDLGLVEKAKSNVKYKWTKPALDDAIATVKRHPTWQNVK